ncbi:uncharacterized protein FFB14_11193 [Fusarium fujikuroi]|nr:uncharacterized protein FFB14_11193 [Fusarium fujikuroi]
MSVTANWQQTLKSTVYYGLFRHFVENITEFWMSFCTPSSEDQEFILSDTGSHVYEGPTVDFQDKATGEFLCLAPRFHLFAPISPRLMIVLRSQHLPEPHEDNNPEIKAMRQLQREIEVDLIYGPGTKSILEDLPAHKAINSYSTLVNGIWTKRPGWDEQLEQLRYLVRLTTLMHAEGRNISLLATHKPVSNHLDIGSYKNQNNAAARWLGGLDKSPADKEEAKDSREQGHDAKVDANQQIIVDLQDEPNEERNNIEDHPIELDPIAKFGDGSREDQLVAMVYEILADRWDSPDLGPKILSRAQVTPENVNESELPSTDRQEKLLRRYQLQQSPILFWLFLKQCRHLIWKIELKEAKRGDVFPGEGPEDEYVNEITTLGPHDLNIKMWKAMNRDIALSRKLGEELSPSELTPPDASEFSTQHHGHTLSRSNDFYGCIFG